MPCPASTGRLFESSEPKAHHVGKSALLFLVVSIAAGLSGVANRSSVSADIAGALFDALIIFVVLLVLGFTVYRPG